MNSYHIDYFLTLCEFMNFTKASEKLSITQQGLSKAIHNLEEELNIPLFKKENHALVLTEYGEYAREQLNKVKDTIDKLKFDLSQMQNETKKVISVAILEGYCKDSTFTVNDLLGIPPPYMQVVPYICSYDEGVKLLENEIVDFFIVKGPNTTEHFDILYRLYEPYYAVVPIDDPLSERDEICIKDLSNKNLIIFNETYKFYDNFFKKIKKYNVTPKIYKTVSEASAIFLPCILGKGIGIVPKFSVNPELDQIEQIKVIPCDREMYEEMDVAVSKTHILSKDTTVFLDNWFSSCDDSHSIIKDY